MWRLLTWPRALSSDHSRSPVVLSGDDRARAAPGGCPGTQSLSRLSSSPAAVDRVKGPSPESRSSNLWVIVGVVIPVLVAMVIVVILYWKLCRTDKLDFQPDAVANIQQRQKVRRWPPSA